MGGFIDLKKLFFVEVLGLSVIAACGPPGGGRYDMTPRIARHFRMFWIPDIKKHELEYIYTQILQGIAIKYLERSLPKGRKAICLLLNGIHLVTKLHL